MFARKLTLFVCTVLVLGLSANGYAADGQPTVKNGFYLGMYAAQVPVGGNFDDTRFYVSGSTVYDVPKVEDGQGFGVVMGGRFPRMAIEMLYQRTTHDTHSSFVDIGDQTAYYNTIDFNFKFDLAWESKARPYLLIGFGIPWITIENSKYDGDYRDETFHGLAANLGAGLAYYFTPKLCINGEAYYRWARFSNVDGDSLDDDLDSEGPIFKLGMAYTF